MPTPEHGQRDFFKRWLTPKQPKPSPDITKTHDTPGSRQQAATTTDARHELATDPQSGDLNAMTLNSAADSSPLSSVDNDQSEVSADADTNVLSSRNSSAIRTSPLERYESTGSVIVSAPTPSPASPPAMLPPTIAPQTSATISFSSVSTLSSIPLSSQSSSRRIVKNGISAVTNSDSGSDDSIDESLPDVSTFLPHKRRRLSPPEDAVPPASSSRLSDFARRNPVRGIKDYGPASPPRPSYKYSLAKLIKQNNSWVKSEAKIADFESTILDTTPNRQLHSTDISADILAASASNDADEQRRMLHALERTEALKNDESFHFFRSETPLYEDAPFPTHALADEPWAKIYRDESTRDSACLTGFAAELAAVYPLPMAVTNWMAQQLIHEPDTALCTAYTDIIKASRTHLTSLSDSLSMFSSFYETHSIAESEKPTTTIALQAPGIDRVVQLVRHCAPTTDGLREDAAPHMTSSALLDFALLNIDAAVQEDIDLSLTVLHSIEDMLDSISETAFDMLVPEVINTLFSTKTLRPLVRYKLIAAFPSCTERTAYLRRRLALQCFGTNPLASNTADDTQDYTKMIVERMKTGEEFLVSEATDYYILTILISVLDAAVAGGFGPYPDRDTASPSAPIGPFGTLTPPSDADSRHDQEIDAITLQLQRIASRIVNVGTSHLKRTEAKSAIELLVARLEGCARSRPKQKRGIFDAVATAGLGRSLFAVDEVDEQGTVPLALLSRPL